MKYHIQYQALERANAILPVPENYPLKQGLADKFRGEMARLTEFARKIYRDIAENPEEYRLLLVDVYEQNNQQISFGIIRDSMNSLNKPFDVLCAVVRAGNINNGVLDVHIPAFMENIKKIKPGKLTGLNKKLNAFEKLGFDFGGYTGKDFADGREYFSVSFPCDPSILQTLKTYYDCVADYPEDKGAWEDGCASFTHPFYLFDYKYTADPDVLPGIVWAKDKVRNWESDAANFYTSFYEHVIKNPRIRYNGNFCKGSKIIARLRYEDDLWKQDMWCYTNPEYKSIITRGMKTYFVLILYLPVKGKPDRFDLLPPHLLEYIKEKKCQDCDAFATQKAKNNGKCPHTVVWEHRGEKIRSCSYYCFHFENPKIQDIETYCSLL